PWDQGRTPSSCSHATCGACQATGPMPSAGSRIVAAQRGSRMSDQINYRRDGSVGATSVALAAADFGMFAAPGPFSGTRVDSEGSMPPLDGVTTWLNSEPLTTEGLMGKVVAIDFWTYTCINWLRTLPYLRAWDEKYRKHGLVMIGVHTPEFPFEHDIENVRRA